MTIKKLEPSTLGNVLRIARLGNCGGSDTCVTGIQMALALARGELDVQPQQYSISVTMNSGSPDKAVPGSLSAPITAPIWVHDVTFQIRQKNGGGFAGSVFAKMNENQFAQNSGIDAQIRVVGGYSLPWLFNGGAASPIESLARWNGAPALSYYSMKRDFMLYFPQQVKADFTPTVQLPDPDTQVILAFNGLQLGFQKMIWTPQEAKESLRMDYGITPDMIQSCVMPESFLSMGGCSDEALSVQDRRNALNRERANQGLPPLESVTDPLDFENERSTAEKSTAAFDPDRMGIGSSPFLRDFSSTGLVVPTDPRPSPAAPLSSPAQRYMFLLAAQVVEAGETMRVFGLRQGITLRAQITVEDRSTRVVEQLITSPLWHPSDGNVSWHFRIARLPPNSARQNDAGSNTYAQTNDLSATSPNLLYKQARPYIPPPLPASMGIGDLGTFYDIRYPWSEQAAGITLDLEIEGPCIVQLLASVKQTDPDSRIVLVPPTYVVPGGLPPEEIFLLNYPSAQYGHILGSIIGELGATQRRPGRRLSVGRSAP